MYLSKVLKEAWRAEGVSEGEIARRTRPATRPPGEGSVSGEKNIKDGGDSKGPPTRDPPTLVKGLWREEEFEEEGGGWEGGVSI